jgi:phage/plasmid primase-like uncharacterized protein
MTNISTENIFDLASSTTRTGIERLLCGTGLHNWMNDWDEAAGDAKCFACGKKSGKPWVYILSFDESVAIWKIVMNIYPEIRKEKREREKEDESDYVEYLTTRRNADFEIMQSLNQTMNDLYIALIKSS